MDIVKDKIPHADFLDSATPLPPTYPPVQLQPQGNGVGGFPEGQRHRIRCLLTWRATLVKYFLKPPSGRGRAEQGVFFGVENSAVTMGPHVS